MIKRDKYKVEFENAKPIVLKRDGHKCVKCSLTFSLEVHHIEGYKHNQPESLITLCYFCHGIAPMGRESFAAWLDTGQSGIEVLETHLAAHGLHGITRAQIVAFCGVLVKLDLDFRVAKFRIARERIRKSGVRCDGRKPYGTFPGEETILAQMVELRDVGNSFHKIAAALNSAGIVTRGGKNWRHTTIAKIFKRGKGKYQ